MSTRSKANGSVNLLGDAMKRVITESLEEVTEPMERRLNKRIDDTNKKIDEGIKTTNKNVQAQLAQNRKDISSDFKKALKAR